MVEINLVVAIIGNKPTFRNVIRKEVLDLTLVSNAARRLIQDWEVSDELSESDHAIIEFRGSCSTETESRVVHIPRSTDWTGYRSSLEVGIKDFPSTINTSLHVDRATDILTGIILRAYHDNSRTLNLKSKEVHWWNATLERLRKKVKKAYRKARSSSPQRKDALFHNWRSLRYEYRRET